MDNINLLPNTINLQLYYLVCEFQSRQFQILQYPEHFQLNTHAATPNLCSLSDLHQCNTAYK